MKHLNVLMDQFNYSSGRMRRESVRERGRQGERKRGKKRRKEEEGGRERERDGRGRRGEKKRWAKVREITK